MTPQELQRLKEENQPVANEPIPQRRFGSGIDAKKQQEYIQRRDQARANLVKISEYEKEAQQVEQPKPQPVQAPNKAYQDYLEGYSYGEKGGIPIGLTGDKMRGYRDYQLGEGQVSKAKAEYYKQKDSGMYLSPQGGISSAYDLTALKGYEKISSPDDITYQKVNYDLNKQQNFNLVESALVRNQKSSIYDLAKINTPSKTFSQKADTFKESLWSKFPQPLQGLRSDLQNINTQLTPKVVKNNELPYGLQTTSAKQSGQEASILFFPRYASQKVGKLIPSKTEKGVNDFINQNFILRKGLPIAENAALGGYQFAVFSPNTLMQTSVSKVSTEVLVSETVFKPKVRLETDAQLSKSILDKQNKNLLKVQLKDSYNQVKLEKLQDFKQFVNLKKSQSPDLKVLSVGNRQTIATKPSQLTKPQLNQVLFKTDELIKIAKLNTKPLSAFEGKESRIKIPSGQGLNELQVKFKDVPQTKPQFKIDVLGKSSKRDYLNKNEFTRIFNEKLKTSKRNDAISLFEEKSLKAVRGYREVKNRQLKVNNYVDVGTFGYSQSQKNMLSILTAPKTPDYQAINPIVLGGSRSVMLNKPSSMKSQSQFINLNLRVPTPKAMTSQAIFKQRSKLNEPLFKERVRTRPPIFYSQQPKQESLTQPRNKNTFDFWKDIMSAKRLKTPNPNLTRNTFANPSLTSMRHDRPKQNQLSLKLKPIIPNKSKLMGWFSFPEGSSKKNVSQKGYTTQIKRFGKWLTLPGIKTRGSALRYGEISTLRTLARSFRIKEAGTIQAPKTNYKPNLSYFRTYTIRKGSKTPVKNTFIERAKYSLDFSGEKSELSSYRRKRRRFL